MASHLFGLLTPQQFLILMLLSARFGLRYEEIAKALYGNKPPKGAKNTITVQLHTIRKVLEPYAVEIVTYESLNNGGYRYAIPMRCRPALADLLDRLDRKDKSGAETRPKPRRR